MHVILFCSDGWPSWDVEFEPLVREGMPVLVDHDLLFEDAPGRPRPAVVVNQWLRELPTSGAPSPNTWQAYARALRDWLVFLGERGLGAFEQRDRLRSGLSLYADYRLSGPLAVRLAEASWDLHTTVLARFYDWAVAEGHAPATPFTYGSAKRLVHGHLVDARRNLAKLRSPRRHTTIKYLERDFADLLVAVLEGLLPDGTPDPGFRGHHPGRNSAVARLVLSSGLRKRESTFLLAPEVPALPRERTALPIPLPVAAAIAKGGKQRTTWVSYDALAAVHRYLELERRLAVDGSAWQPDPAWGAPLVVTSADCHGGVVNGRRHAWSRLTPRERLRLVDSRGGSLVLAVRSDGAPFRAWDTVLRRASEDVRVRLEPRFPHVHPHRLRHTMAMTTLQDLVAGYYAQAARLVADTGQDAALALYLTKSDPIQVLRDLLGHSSVTTTEIYLSRLDTTRIFRELYDSIGGGTGLSASVSAEVDQEFAENVVGTERAGVSWPRG